MSKIIIGIHGLGNKPPGEFLERSWKKALHEGLHAAGYPSIPLNIEMVYWADLMYASPLDPAVRDRSSPCYDDEPYIPAQSHPTKAPSKLRQKVLDLLSKQLEALFLNEDKSINFEPITDLIIQRYFRELDMYYCTSCIVDGETGVLVKDVIRKTLQAVLLRHKDKKILLLGHSMGSIIAYDVVSQCPPAITIDTFVTIGSPLGIPVVISKIVSEQNSTGIKNYRPKVPESITRHWYNFSDLEDNMTVNYRLDDDFKKNTRGVGITDKIVSNNYEYEGTANPHKSYGYLRTPEMADVVYAFHTRGTTEP
jgi:hypothetical protein